MINLNEKLIRETDIISEDVDIIPCNTGVLIKFYDKNPYRALEKNTEWFDSRNGIYKDV